MIRELDEVSLAFSMWEQARKELAQAEERLHALRGRAHTTDELDILLAEIALAREKTDRTLQHAIDTLRSANARA
jgi:hypothetical protein